MIDAERRKARRDFYRALDPANVFQRIGYDYLADETGFVLEEVPASRPYRPQPHEASLCRHKNNVGVYLAKNPVDLHIVSPRG